MLGRRPAWLIAAHHSVRMAAGPLTLAGFFLPWAHGPGLLAANEFTGFSLVAFTGRLQQLELSVTASSVLLAIRIALLLVAVCATWLTLLAPRHTWHPGYHIAGWYIVVTAATAGGIGLLRAGIEVPPSGLALWLAGSLAFAVSAVFMRSPARHRPPHPTVRFSTVGDEPVH